MLTRAVRQMLLRIASRAPLCGGSVRVLFPDGTQAMLGKEPPVFELSVTQEAKLWRKLVFGSEIGFGEAYMQGLWTTSDLPGLLQFGAQNRVQINNWALEFLAAGLKWRDRRRHLQRRNTPERSKDNIHEHYDLGNDFFRLFLDETLTYSCAVFEHPGQDLPAAQHNKYRLMCQKASITPDDHVLEIGTGWGEFALFVAQNYGCRVTSISISQEQVALARKRVCEAGLESQVEVLLLDYRSVEGHYDKIISIEMFEAVGAEYFTTFFQACEKVLKPGGKLVLQVITVPERSFPTQKNEVSWVQKHIFPGGVLPSVAAMERAATPTSLLLKELTEIGEHYAATLKQWREQFLAHLPAVRELGFTELFIRKWEYYLALCEAGFRARVIGDVQIVFEKP